MENTDWFLIDTETTGLSAPIFVVELAAQKMRGWEPEGARFVICSTKTPTYRLTLLAFTATREKSLNATATPPLLSTVIFLSMSEVDRSSHTTLIMTWRKS